MRTKDLIFLLTHQPWESESNQVLSALGKKLMALRQERGLTQVEVADHLGMLKDNITHMEQGPRELRGQKKQGLIYTSFHRFWAYTEYLNNSCVEGFSQVLVQKEENARPAIHEVHGLRKQVAVSREQKILEQVQQAVQDLRALGQAVTFEAVAQRVGLSKKCLSNRPSVKAYLEQAGCKQSPGLKRSRWEEEEVLKHVCQAIEQLEAQGRSATLSLIKEMVRLPVATLLSFPGVRRLLEKVEAQRSLALGCEAQHREDELVEKVRVAIGLLEEKGQKITQQSIATIVQQSVETLRACPRVRAILEEQMAKGGFRGQLGITSSREQELVDEVAKAIKQLTALGKAVTWKSVSQLIGVQGNTLRYYTSIRILLNQAAQERRQAYIREGGLREETLVAEALKAIDQLKYSEQPVTPVAIAQILQRSLLVLKTYPQVKALLEQVQEAEKARVKRIKQQTREAEFLKLIEEAVHYLESNGQPVTKAAVGQIIHVLPTTFSHFPRIQAFWAQVTARRSQEEEANEKLYEGKLLKQVEEAIGLLILQKQPVTQRAIQSLVGVSIDILKKYSCIDLLLASFTKLGCSSKRAEVA